MHNLNKHGLKEINPINHIYEPEKHIVVENYEDKTKVKLSY